MTYLLVIPHMFWKCLRFIKLIGLCGKKQKCFLRRFALGILGGFSNIINMLNKCILSICKTILAIHAIKCVTRCLLEIYFVEHAFFSEN